MKSEARRGESGLVQETRGKQDAKPWKVKSRGGRVNKQETNAEGEPFSTEVERICRTKEREEKERKKNSSIPNTCVRDGCTYEAEEHM